MWSKRNIFLHIFWLSWTFTIFNIHARPQLLNERQTTTVVTKLKDESLKSYETKSNSCHPPPSERRPQFIVGYGSLMQQESKSRTAPNTGESIPVLVKGFRRAWNLLGKSVGLSTTYLGVVPADNEAESSFNAIVFQLLPTVNAGASNLLNTNSSVLVQTIENYDEREAYYCRQKVPNQNIIPLVSGNFQGMNSSGFRNFTGNTILNPLKNEEADFWIYVNKEGYISSPTKNSPIVQSYVDLFISGCLEIEENFHLPNFTDFCIASTYGWSKEWVNDRIYPRRPFIFQPKATLIDQALARNMPSTFSLISVEG